MKKHLKLFKIYIIIKNIAKCLIQYNKFNFSQQNENQNNNNQEKNEEQTHPDFQPKIKIQEDASENQVTEMIDKQVKGNKVCIFMKGTPQMPMCGYSNFVIQILKFYKIKDYQAVDILKNEAVRKQVKLYSNWPTFPQLFIDGKLIGGSDIVSEMHKDGSLKDLLQKSGLIQNE
ncbi:glutaredoxin-like protein, putative [Ichthyophthirius multifiliis]|uniref:Glutaredoxin-like protein, putative n=1 Tax=Ichthyophthirius multifiliis TaxID=5932 RepID=G0R4F8_ICHMU|nr:glutaredoxin-like protein, putative [Ichthyophthirius multifiliis]EGR27647.1 glutaredoxin-like protein, putative [Ichthyophthirius multifiliis]|eukprot:XP_004025099.1 glutaredoxin-like protein, putative [Ichthyophthirius multifiliis]